MIDFRLPIKKNIMLSFFVFLFFKNCVEVYSNLRHEIDSDLLEDTHGIDRLWSVLL